MTQYKIRFINPYSSPQNVRTTVFRPTGEDKVTFRKSSHLKQAEAYAVQYARKNRLDGCSVVLSRSVR